MLNNLKVIGSKKTKQT